MSNVKDSWNGLMAFFPFDVFAFDEIESNEGFYMTRDLSMSHEVQGTCYC